MKITILGCGTSTGVPVLPGDWGQCDPSNPKNRRRRAAVLVEAGDTTVLIDCGPDIRAQLLDAGAARLDAVLVTHDHADHTHGIDDLRGYYLSSRDKLPLYTAKETLDRLHLRFDYIFKSRHGYPPICEGHVIDMERPLLIGDLPPVRAFWQEHGSIWSLGFRIGDFAYSTDLNALPEESFDILAGAKLWVVDALRERPHPSHSHLEQTLSWIDRVRPDRAVLTHMTKDMDYDTLRGTLPAGVEPAYDGMTLNLDSH